MREVSVSDEDFEYIRMSEECRKDIRAGRRIAGILGSFCLTTALCSAMLGEYELAGFSAPLFFGVRGLQRYSLRHEAEAEDRIRRVLGEYRQAN